jgi:hypothetical protein
MFDYSDSDFFVSVSDRSNKYENGNDLSVFRIVFIRTRKTEPRSGLRNQDRAVQTLKPAHTQQARRLEKRNSDFRTGSGRPSGAGWAWDRERKGLLLADPR